MTADLVLSISNTGCSEERLTLTSCGGAGWVVVSFYDAAGKCIAGGNYNLRSLLAAAEACEAVAKATFVEENARQYANIRHENRASAAVQDA